VFSAAGSISFEGTTTPWYFPYPADGERSVAVMVGRPADRVSIESNGTPSPLELGAHRVHAGVPSVTTRTRRSMRGSVSAATGGTGDQERRDRSDRDGRSRRRHA
jgi:hypothetical protein